MITGAETWGYLVYTESEDDLHVVVVSDDDLDFVHVRPPPPPILKAPSGFPNSSFASTCLLNPLSLPSVWEVHAWLSAKVVELQVDVLAQSTANP